MENVNKLISVLSDTIQSGVFSHYHFCGPHENDVQYVVNSIFRDHYVNKSFVLEIHILDNKGESALIQMIQSFCNLQAVVTGPDKKPKIVIIHQQNEILTENLVHFLENRMSDKHVKFVFMSNSMHIVPSILLSKMVSFIIHPFNKNINDDFYKIINSTKDDDIISNAIIEWSKLHCIKAPSIIYEEWQRHILSSV